MDESPFLGAGGPSEGAALGCPFGGGFGEPLRMDGRRKRSHEMTEDSPLVKGRLER